MNDRYFERMHVAEQRRRDREMVFAALYARRRRAGRRRLLQAVLWLIGGR
ncbi:MAG: hypothetical protein HC822_00160 [Oscillochloris sp.]|nr:hypothetical protein [Oscillochloris sp.]